jgi:Protein of unknown function (DUF3142)
VETGMWCKKCYINVMLRNRLWSKASTYVVLATVAPCVGLLAFLLARQAKHQRFSGFPQITLWAWERPEDLRIIDPTRFAVGYLDQTITITDHVEARPRFQPLLVPAAAKVISVVRIDARLGSARLDSPGVNTQVSEMIMESTRRPGVAALQIDFDAAESQHDFYSELLRDVRRRMPPSMPLSITALASWCSRTGWLADLPVDEAVPMFFRMGRDPHSSVRPGWKYPIREPLCSASAGVSTDEAWPHIDAGQRIYVFHSRAWDGNAVKSVLKLIGQ